MIWSHCSGLRLQVQDLGQLQHSKEATATCKSDWFRPIFVQIHFTVWEVWIQKHITDTLPLEGRFVFNFLIHLLDSQ